MPGVILLNPVTGTVNLSEPITGTVGLSGPITGAVKLTEAPQIASGSVVGLLVGGQPASAANPVPITGSISVTAPAVQNVTGSAWTPQVIITGSVPLTGTFGLSGPITGTVGLSGPITGTVGISGPVAVSNFPAVQTVTGSVGLTGPVTGAVKLTEAPQIASGSVTGLLLGGQPVSQANPIPITGSISVSPPAVQNVTGSNWTPQVVITGSVPLTGTFGLSGPITGTVGLSGPITGNVGVTNFPAVQTVTGSVGLTGPVTGNVGITGPVAISNFPATQVVSASNWVPVVAQGPVASGSQPWNITGSVGLSGPITGTVGLSGPITGNVGITAPVTVLPHQITSGSVTGLLVGGQPVSSLNPVPISGNLSVTFPAVQTITGSVGLTAPITGTVGISGPLTGNFGLSGPITGNVGITAPVTVLPHSITSGSVTGLLLGGQPVASTNPVPVTGTVGLSGPVAISNFPATQTVTGSVGLAGPITGTVGLSGPVTGAVKLTEAPQIASGSVTGLLVGGQPVSNANPVPITGSVSVVGQVVVSGSANVSGTVTTNGPGLAASRAGFCFGKLDTTVGGEQLIEHTTYTEMTGNFKVSLQSVSGTDTVAAGGTGARLVRVTYYDVTGSGPFTETVQMSGTTPVPLSASTTCFFEKLEVITAGTYGTNKGTISLKIGATGAGALVGSVLGNHGRTYWAHHYIPSGTTCYITGMYGAHFNNTSAGSGGTFYLRSKDLLLTDSVNVQLTDYLNAYGQSSAPVRTYGTPIRVKGPTKLSMYVFPDTALTVTYVGSFDFYEQDNT